jgi:hypothetical protein
VGYHPWIEVHLLFSLRMLHVYFIVINIIIIHILLLEVVVIPVYKTEISGRGNSLRLPLNTL